MRIAYIINSVEGGGAALPVPDVTRLMRRLGHEVRVFALTRRDGRAIVPMVASGLGVDVREGGVRDHVSALRWLLRELRDWQPTLLWTSLSRATLLGQIAGQRLHLPVVSWQHSARLKPANAFLLRARRHRSLLWIADSSSVAAQTIKTLRIPADDLVIWPIFRADPATPVARPWQPGEPVRIGTLGRLHPVKGFDALIEAAALLRETSALPPLSFSIAGEGAERGRLEALAQARGVDVTFTGYCANPLDYLRTLHLYAQPSHWEGLCLAAHEAMLCGLPVVASNAGEIPYTVEPGKTGLIVPPKNPRALAGALHTLLSQPQNLAEMGARARTRVLARFGAEAFDRTGSRIIDRVAALTT
ncbi:glycosyltransferase family 4 protein [Tanticharoenia sakaeratensis]|uniref:Glycosyl transferase group 1 n=1 Tax=Tanticharoenia sakaeratensis NBRC 103193 TaxID=1231623 RepID=A0A0D6MJE8_9PROT|nr:glycosyltransferase family 4 protein [Tanticharoenia sakaeratensis]GAN53769.1 glycosyl transferase group 1 [Tanticharoenia sakaeratensis NBRC 103193]